MHAYAPAHSPYLTAAEDAPTLAAVLAVMGHDCHGLCPTEAAGLEAVWHTARAAQVGSVGLVLVDLSTHDESVRGSARLLADVNRCTGRDRILVRSRHDWSGSLGRMS
jgi:hypothetical protein